GRDSDGSIGTHGPQIAYRMYAPDRYDPSGGVSLPLIRIQRPGGEPELAPPIQELWYNWRLPERYQIVPPVVGAQNVCGADGVTTKDAELANKRHQLVVDTLAKQAPPGVQDAAAAKLVLPDGSLLLLKTFGAARALCASTHGRNCQTN